MQSVQSIEEVHQLLEAIPQFSKEGKGAADFKLDRFSSFCQAMGQPHTQFPSIHVAGSNGKGSTCHIIGAVLQAAGYRVGVYTSPHIVDFAERFTVNGQVIGDEELVQFFNDHAALLEEYRPTYFEISTAIAFWWFARRSVDVAVIETGLGGRLDATNIITPLVSVITNVTLDHTNILGDTLARIAYEKAGIIKKGVPVVTGNIPVEAAGVIKVKAREEGSAHFSTASLRPRYAAGRYCLHTEAGDLRLQSTLAAPVQAYNIAASWLAIRQLPSHLGVDASAFREGVARVDATHPNTGRFERLHPDYRWYFDGAHNLDAVQAMKQMVETMQPVDETTLVLSIMNDKINEKVMAEFSEFKKIVYHTLPTQRAASWKEILEWLPQADHIPATQDIPKTLLKEFEHELVIFAGSFYLYKTVRDWLSTFANH